MAFIITADHLTTDKADPHNKTGLLGGKGWRDSKAYLEQGGGHPFKVFDDDGEMYYSGRCTSKDDEEAFEPLNWATRDAGATRIDYLQFDGQWVTL